MSLPVALNGDPQCMISQVASALMPPSCASQRGREGGNRICHCQGPPRLIKGTLLSSPLCFPGADKQIKPPQARVRLMMVSSSDLEMHPNTPLQRYHSNDYLMCSQGESRGVLFPQHSMSPRFAKLLCVMSSFESHNSTALTF